MVLEKGEGVDRELRDRAPDLWIESSSKFVVNNGVNFYCSSFFFGFVFWIDCEEMNSTMG